MSSVEIEVATTAGPKKIPAESVPNAPFVIFNTKEHKFMSPRFGGNWSVTHAHTGYAAVHAKTKAGARRAAKQLAKLGIDWAQSPGELEEAAAGYRERILEIRAQAMAT